MIFSILITASPCTHQAGYTAYQFAQAVLEKNHRIHRIFFYQDAVHVGNRWISPLQDEFNLTKSWQALAQQHGFELTLCAAAALRRGLLDTEEASQQENTESILAPNFQLAGLGQLLEALITADRFITFGP